MALFALIAGFFFYFGLSFFVQRSMESAMTGQAFPMDINEWVVRPLLSNVNVVGLFLIPMITMRLFAEEKRTGTIELLMTSPHHDIEIVLGKWLAAVGLYSIMLLVSLLHMAILFRYGQPDWKPDGGRLSGAAAARRMPAGHRHVHFHLHQESDRRRRGWLRDLPAAVGAQLGFRVRQFDHRIA